MDSSMFEGEKKIRRRLSPFRACWTFLEQKPTCCRLIRHYCSVAIFLSMTNNTAFTVLVGLSVDRWRH